MKQKRSRTAIICEWCRAEALVTRKGKSTPRFCSGSCAKKYVNSLPQMKLARAEASKRRRKLVRCEWCGVELWMQLAERKRFYGHSCAALWRWSQPGMKERAKQWMQRARESNPTSDLATK